MTPYQMVGEYDGIRRRAEREGWVGLLIRAHATACSQDTASHILDCLTQAGYLPASLKRVWRNRTHGGRALGRRGKYTIILPTIAGTRRGELRVGIVLHEAAHIMNFQRNQHGHGEVFCRQFHKLLDFDWRKLEMPTTNYREIYDRHRGPFSLLITREVPSKKGIMEQETERVAGPMSADEAHEEARTLVNRVKDNVIQAFVFSDTEGQFIGALYERGVAYKPWHEEETRDAGRMELPDERPSPALLPGREELMRPVDDPVEQRVPKRSVPRDRPVRTVPPEGAPQPRAKRPKSKLGIAADKIEAWPKSPAAQLVRTTLIELGEAGITAADLAEQLGPALKDLGVAFPASLVSRLKQAGLITEVTSEQQEATPA